jgi:hypothetical protein
MILEKELNIDVLHEQIKIFVFFYEIKGDYL